MARQENAYITIYNDAPANNNRTNFVKPIAISVAIIVMLAVAGLVVLALNPNATANIEENEEDERAALAAYIGTTEMQDLFKNLLGKEVVISFLPSDYFKDNDKFYISADTERKTGTIRYESSTEYITFHITNDEVDTPDTAVDFVLHEEIDGIDTYVMQTGLDTYQFFNGSVKTEYNKLEYALLDHQLLRN